MGLVNSDSDSGLPKTHDSGDSDSDSAALLYLIYDINALSDLYFIPGSFQVKYP